MCKVVQAQCQPIFRTQDLHLRFTIYDLLLVRLPHSSAIGRTPTFFENYLQTGSEMTEPEKQTATIRSPEDDSPEELRALLAGYEARLSEVAELVARVRHEINNPLAGVLGQAQLLLREELNERARKRAETIEELATRLRDVVAQLRQIQTPAKLSGKEEEHDG
jgi:signal transduction histidine kinase